MSFQSEGFQLLPAPHDFRTILGGTGNPHVLLQRETCAVVLIRGNANSARQYQLNLPWRPFEDLGMTVMRCTSVGSAVKCIRALMLRLLDMATLIVSCC